MAATLFAYGTLEFPELMQALIGQQVRAAAATLHGYRRGLLVGRRYPGIVASPDDDVVGSVYYDLGNTALQAIDEFEAEEYERIEVDVVRSDGRSVTAYAYVVHPRFHDLVSSQPWDAQDFRARHLADYLTALEHA